jgi:putative Holliday junction resolvase
MSKMRLLGLDFGTKRIGVAVSDEMGWTAGGVGVIKRKSMDQDLDAVGRFIQEYETSAVVIGLPFNMNGSSGWMARLVRDFAQRVHKRIGVDVHLWDERLTSWEAEETLKECGVKVPKRARVKDKLAASLILQSYLQVYPVEEKK